MIWRNYIGKCWSREVFEAKGGPHVHTDTARGTVLPCACSALPHPPSSPPDFHPGHTAKELVHLSHLFFLVLAELSFGHGNTIQINSDLNEIEVYFSHTKQSKHKRSRNDLLAIDIGDPCSFSLVNLPSSTSASTSRSKMAAPVPVITFTVQPQHESEK